MCVEVARTLWAVSTTPPTNKKFSSTMSLESSRHLFLIGAARGDFGVVVYYDHAFIPPLSRFVLAIKIFRVVSYFLIC